MSLDLMSLKLLFLPTRTVQPWEALLERRDGEATVVSRPRPARRTPAAPSTSVVDLA